MHAQGLQIAHVGEVFLVQAILRLADGIDARVCGCNHPCDQSEYQPEANEQLVAGGQIQKPFHACFSLYAFLPAIPVPRRQCPSTCSCTTIASSASSFPASSTTVRSGG